MAREAGRALGETRKRFQEWRFLRRLAGPKLVRAFDRVYPEAVFVEIGANDGEKFDHLHDLVHSGRWRGVMVEPVPYVFERLRANYEHLPLVSLENSAIAGSDGELPFFHLAPADAAERAMLPDWYDALGSFSRDNVLRHRTEIPDIEDRLVTTTVPCLTYQALCAEHRLDRVDLLLIDTEGYDHEILKQVDLATRPPRMVVYEHFHLDAADRAACRRMVEGSGYLTLEEGFDTWCLLQQDGDDALSRAWRTVRPGIPPLYKHDLDAART